MYKHLLTGILSLSALITGCSTAPQNSSVVLPSYEIHNEFIKLNLATYELVSRQVAQLQTETNVNTPFIHTRTVGRRFPDSTGAIPVLKELCRKHKGVLKQQTGIKHGHLSRSELIKCMSRKDYIYVANLTHRYDARSQTIVWEENFFTMYTYDQGNQIAKLYQDWLP